MDERLRFVARLLEGEKWRRCAPNSRSRGRPATRFSSATKIAASRRSAIGAGGLIARPIERADLTLIDLPKHSRMFHTDQNGPNEGAPILVRWTLHRRLED